jgi:hypothetical protein
LGAKKIIDLARGLFAWGIELVGGTFIIHCVLLPIGCSRSKRSDLCSFSLERLLVLDGKSTKVSRGNERLPPELAAQLLLL